MVGVAVFVLLVASVSCGDVDVGGYLEQFGYLNAHSFNSNVTESLVLFQNTFQLKPTGKLDADTLKLMHTPRCGNHDMGGVSYRDTAWNHKALTYYYYNYSPDLSQNSIRSTVARGLKYWSDVTPLTFTERQGGDINIAFGSYRHRDSRGSCRDPFDGPSKVLAHAYFPPIGRIHFDESEKWTVGGARGINLLWVATHEMGHIMGLEHDTVNKAAVMYPYYRSYNPNMRLHANDIRRIQRLYGKSGSGGGGGGGGGCVDENSNCSKWARGGYCRGSSHSRWMQAHCCRSCKGH